MANGYFERGEMYDILFSDGLSGEMTAHRPGIIVSSDRGNTTNPSVMIVYTTTTTANKRIGVNHEFVMNGWTNFALCNQIATINKTRLKKFYGKLSTVDMDAIDRCIEEALDLGYVDEAALKAKDEEIADRDVLIGDLQTEVAGVKAEIEQKDEEIASLKMEIEMWQKCYGRCMDMLVDTKVNGDLTRRTVAVAPVANVVEEPVEEDPPKQSEPPKEDCLDINSCTATALKKAGFSIAVARKIVESRPFTSVEDVKRVNGVKASLYRILAPKLCCEPLVEQETEAVKKVNVNTATAQEIHDVTGIGLTACFGITGYRSKNGPYTSLEGLLNANRMTSKMLEKYRDKLEV